MVYLDHHDALIERLASQNCWTVLTNVSKDNGFWQMKEHNTREGELNNRIISVIMVT